MADDNPQHLITHVALNGQARTHVATGEVSSSYGQPLNEKDRVDVNNFGPSEWEDHTRIWQERRASVPSDDHLTANISEHSWIIDNGASHHMSGNLAYFTNVIDIDPCPVGMPNGDMAVASKSGSCYEDGDWCG